MEKRILDKMSPHCYHLKGNGGLKGAIRDVMWMRNQCPFVFRTDVKSYYDSINHEILLSKLSTYVDDGKILELVRQYLNRTVVKDGVFRDVSQAGDCQGMFAFPTAGGVLPG